MIQDSISVAAQRAYSATLGRGAIALSVVGTSEDAGASRLAAAIAISGAAFGKRVLLMRAVNTPASAPLDCDAASLRNAATRIRDRLYLLDVPAGTQLHSLMNDGLKLLAAFADWTSEFDAFVIDCPPYGAEDPALYTPLTASATDAVLLVSTPGAIPREEFDAILKWLKESGADPSAIVFNDRFNPTLGQEMVRETERLRRLSPGLASFVARRIAAWPPLNRHY